MAKQQKISEYIDNISFKKKLGMGLDPDEVYAAICDLSSMYNEVLAESHQEIEELKSTLKTQRPPMGAGSDGIVRDYASFEQPAEIPARPFLAEREESSYVSKGLDAPLSSYAEPKTPPIPPAPKPKMPPMEAKEPIAPPAMVPAEEPLNAAELRRMDRQRLLELLLECSKENQTLRAELQQKAEENRLLQERLEDKRIIIEKAGTLAEASMMLNGVMDATQAAAQQYLDNLQELYERQNVLCDQKEAAARLQARRILDDARAQSEAMLRRAEEDCRLKEAESRMECEKIRAEADTYWEELSGRLETFYSAHEGIKELLGGAGAFMGGKHE